MNVSLSQAAGAMNAASRWQEVISQNLASASVPGHRHQVVSFANAAREAGMNGASASMPIPLAQVSTSFSPGVIRPTGNQTDVAIVGSGFFEVLTTDGKTAYTRDGEFRLSPEGGLVTKSGHQVQGTNGPIQVDLNNNSPLQISPTGEVSQGENRLGQLTLTDFNDPNLLTQAGEGLFLAEDPGLENQPSTATVRQNFLEGSNTAVVAEMTQMIQAMRLFEANQKVIRIADERMSKSITQLTPQP